MTEFNPSTAIGAISVEVRLDRSKYDGDRSKLRSDAEADEKFLKQKYTMASTASQASYPASWKFAPAGGRRGGGPAWTGGGSEAMPAVPPVAREGGSGLGNGSGSGAGSRGARGSVLDREVGFSAGHSLLSAYAISRAGEAVMNFASVSMEATRNLKFAVNDSERIRYMIETRSNAESALSQVPIAGPLGIATNNLVTSWFEQSPADIARLQAEASRTNDLYGGMYANFNSNRVRRAAAQAGMYPNRNFGLEQSLVGARLGAQRASIADERQENSNKFQPTNAVQEFYDSGHLANSPIGHFAVWLNGGEAGPSWQAKADIKNTEIEQARTIGRAQIDAKDKVAEIEAKAATAQLEFAKTNLNQELIIRKDVADLTIQRKFVAADVAKRYGEFRQAVFNTPEELKQYTRETMLSESKSELQQRMMDIGRNEAAPVDVTRDVVGDPSGLRAIVDPIESLHETIKRQEGDTLYFRKR